MTYTVEEINRIAQLVLTGSDQTYGALWKGVPLAPINNFGGTNLQPYVTPPGFVCVDVMDDPTTGFRAAIYKNPNTNGPKGSVSISILN